MDADLRAISRKYQEKLEKIKLAIFDVDGILTDGRLLYMGEEVGFNRFFNVRDGYGIKMLHEFGIEVAIISGGDSLGLRKRIKGLKIKHSYLGNEDKRKSYLELLENTKQSFETSLYVGDEFFDIPLLRKAGFSATVKSASFEVKEVCDYVCHTPSGHGVAREVIELLRYAQNLYPQIPEIS